MATGEWIRVLLPDLSVGAAASSSDSTVLREAGGTQTATLGSKVVFAAFQAVNVGTAQLTFTYLTCPPEGPCSYEVEVTVVQFPKPKVSLSNLPGDTWTAQLKVGESARFLSYGAVPSKWTIKPQGIVRWSVDPIYEARGVEGAVTAISPGTATVTEAFQSPAPDGATSWNLTVVVS